jgi:hypothetical protein
MKFFNFLFYKSYRLALLLGNEGFYPEVVAWGITMFLLWFNLFSILILLENNLIISPDLFKYLLIGSLIFWVASYIYYILKGNYINIIDVKEQSNNNNIYSVIYYCYLLISLICYGFLSN